VHGAQVNPHSTDSVGVNIESLVYSCQLIYRIGHPVTICFYRFFYRSIAKVIKEGIHYRRLYSTRLARFWLQIAEYGLNLRPDQTA